MDPTLADDLPRMVRTLHDRQAIHDCIARYCRGVDRFDRDIIRSAFHPDALDEHGKFVGNPEEFADWALGQHGAAHLSHQHLIMNHLCEIEGDTAHAETYFMFISMNRTGRTVTLGGGRYIDRLERRDQRWAIAARVCLRDWSMMDERPDMDDLSSFTSTRALLSAAERAFMNGGRAARRDRTDPSYDRPLRVDAARAEAWREHFRTGKPHAAGHPSQPETTT